MKQIILSLLVSFSLSQSACTQNNKAGNQKVDIVNAGDPETNKGSAEVKDESAQTKAISNEMKADPDAEKDGSGIENDGSASVKYGKYNCTASKYSNGSYEYLPKGSFVLSKDGSYTYHGFEKPSTGKFKTNDSGIIHLLADTLMGEKPHRSKVGRIDIMLFFQRYLITGGPAAGFQKNRKIIS